MRSRWVICTYAYPRIRDCLVGYTSKSDASSPVQAMSVHATNIIPRESSSRASRESIEMERSNDTSDTVLQSTPPCRTRRSDGRSYVQLFVTLFSVLFQGQARQFPEVQMNELSVGFDAS